MTRADSDFVHVYRPGDRRKPTLLLLHGTGGDEHDLITLGELLVPDATLLSPRGQVLEHGMPRFFRRFAEGVLDVDDLKTRAAGLAAWVQTQVRERAAPERVIAVGFSNGANIAAGIMLAHPGVLAGAVLFRAMVPYEPDEPPQLTGVPVLICAGRSDPMIDTAQAERLADMFRRGGADVTLTWQNTGHGLVQADVDAAAEFLATRFDESP